MVRLLSVEEIQQIQGADGFFKVVVKTPVPTPCATFIIRTYEKIMTGEMTRDEAGKVIFISEFPTDMIELALQGIDIIYWN